MKKILLPIDGSEFSKKSLQFAEDLDLIQAGEIHLISVIQAGYASSHMDGDVNFYPGHVIHPREEAEEVMGRAVKYLADKGITAHTHIPLGDPAQMILETAKNIEADLIVIGNRGLGAFSRAFLGSVSTKVMNHAHCSVLIVKKPE